jgi:hypothetical protein
VEGNDLNPLISNYFTNLFTSEVNGTYPMFLKKNTTKGDWLDECAALGSIFTRGG